jgi:hypothetical protein
MKDDKDFRSSGLYKAVLALEEIKARMRALGKFAEDRDMLECDKCTLMETVTFQGYLSTYFRPSYFDDPVPPLRVTEPEDTGYRFEEIAENLFRCPACGNEIVYEEKPLEVEDE